MRINETLIQRTFENEFNEVHYKELVLNLFNHFDFSKEHTLKHQFNDAERQALNDFTYFGTYEDAEKKCLDVLTVELKSSSKVERARSLQRNLIGKYLKTNLKDSALVAFYSKDNPDWRLSFVKMDYRLDMMGVKVEIGTPPKRYSFLVGKTEPSHTAQKQLLPLLDDRKVPTLDEIEKSFSIEKVTKEFYTEIAKKFTELVGGERKIGSKKIVEAGVLKYPKPSDTLRKEFAVRLIGRLMFCWFLKKKKSEGGVPLIPNVLLSSDAISQYLDYYHSLLEPLFFQVLNTPVEKRNKRVRHSFWNNVPFLNGGLFEPHLYDYYETYYESGLSKYINTLKVPDSWFLDLFKIFEIYNFTIDESTSIDIEISVDPEMLGRIFENLLAEINPETGETARKSTGSYYTPRPIVEYMVDESLKQYLLSQIPTLTKGGEGGFLDENKLNKLLSYGDWEIELTESEKDAIIDALDKVKIIDPACGSGAFPMGILHKMLLILQKIDPESKQWLSKKLARIDNEILRKELEKKLKTENWDYVHKLGIIQNSIYGVDIQPIAVEISKLRFFLSLIVDEKIDDDKPNRGVVPLPNLEFKFVAANSLIGLPHTMQLSQMELFEARDYIKSLRQLRDDYFASYGEDKRKIEQDFRQIQQKMFEYASKEMVTHKKTLETQTLKLSEWNPFSDEASSWFDPEWMFEVKDGFDIVIANPPYGIVFDLVLKAIYESNYPTFIRNNDIYVAFYEKGVNLLKNYGLLVYISPNTFLNGDYFKRMRKFLTAETIIKEIRDYKEIAIFHDSTVFVCVFICERKSKIIYPYQAIINTAKEESIGNYIKSSFTTENSSEAAFRPSNSILEKLSKNSKLCLVDNLFWVKDVGFNYWTKGKGKKRDGNSIGNRVFYNGQRKHPKDIPFLKGRDLNKWYFTKPNNYLKYDYEKYLDNKLDTLRFSAEFIERKPKIIYRQTANTIIAAIDNSGNYLDKTVHLIIPKISWEKYPAKFLLGLLNSTLLGYLYKRISQETEGRAFAQVKTTYIKRLSVPKEPKDTSIVKIVDQILSIKQKDPNADTSALERQIDKMVYELYELTPEEIDIVEGKR
jgi:hypothetical protein